jgi:hypothetical protein
MRLELTRFAAPNAPFLERSRRRRPSFCVKMRLIVKIGKKYRSARLKNGAKSVILKKLFRRRAFRRFATNVDAEPSKNNNPRASRRTPTFRLFTRSKRASSLFSKGFQ